MKELLKTGNPLINKATNFAEAKLSDQQIQNLQLLTKANFKGHVDTDESTPPARPSLLSRLLGKFGYGE